MIRLCAFRIANSQSIGLLRTFVNSANDLIRWNNANQCKEAAS
jgi:hypothetical protein